MQEPQQQQQQPQQHDALDAYLIMPVKIESLVKDFKTHQCALDFDRGYIKALMICPN